MILSTSKYREPLTRICPTLVLGDLQDDKAPQRILRRNGHGDRLQGPCRDRTSRARRGPSRRRPRCGSDRETDTPPLRPRSAATRRRLPPDIRRCRNVAPSSRPFHPRPALSPSWRIRTSPRPTCRAPLRRADRSAPAGRRMQHPSRLRPALREHPMLRKSSWPRSAGRRKGANPFRPDPNLAREQRQEGPRARDGHMALGYLAAVRLSWPPHSTLH